MSQMIERAAQAICGDDNPDNILAIHRDRARAAIEAMREPTKKMLSAGGFYHIIGAGSVSESDMEIAKREWQAMIDEALR